MQSRLQPTEEKSIYSEAAHESGQDGVLIRVVDNGVGIPEQLQSRLFTPFVSTKEGSGTGLGLWVSRSVVEKHGGSIRLENRKDHERGTTVSIFLPLTVASRKGGHPEDESVARREAAS